MTSNPQNPRAFPRPDPVTAGRDYLPQCGMSLRDWFAGQALAALPIEEELVSAEVMASDAYRIADAMLAERAKGGAA